MPELSPQEMDNLTTLYNSFQAENNGEPCQLEGSPRAVGTGEVTVFIKKSDEYADIAGKLRNGIIRAQEKKRDTSKNSDAFDFMLTLEK